MIEFTDLSAAQAPAVVNYAKLATWASGAYVCCGEGLRDRDAAYVDHAKRCRDAGMRHGAYHVIAPSSKDPRGQARRAVEWADQVRAPDRLPLAIDVERNSPLGADAPRWRDFLFEYVEELDSWCGTVMYMNTSFANDLIKAGIGARWQGPWWIAEYGTLKYPTPQAEALRKSVIEHHYAAAKALAAGDPKRFRTELDAKYRDGRALARLELHPVPVKARPGPVQGANVVAYQYGGDVTGCTGPGVDGLLDRNYFFGSDADWTAFRM